MKFPKGLVAIGLALTVTVTAGGHLARMAGTAEPRRIPVPQDPRLSLGEIIEGDVVIEDLPPDVLPDSTVRLDAKKGEGALEGPPALPEQTEVSLPVGWSYDFVGYPDPEVVNAFLMELEQRYPDLVEVFTIGTSWQGRPIMAARLTNELAPQPIQNRPAMYIDAQHHAREIVTNAVALYTLWSLADVYGFNPTVTHLLDTRALYVVPSVNVDGNAIALADYQEIRKTANPTSTDDDGDGAYDEDYSEGYGYGTHTLYRYVFDEEWADENPTNPFVSDWRSHLLGDVEVLGRFTGVHGGPEEPIQRNDRDGDGQQDEDEIGGVDPNRNYAAHWEDGDARTVSGSYRGPEVWSEPEVRAVRDLVAELPTLATALSYHSGTDLILHPWGWSETADLPDVSLFELIARKGTQLTEVHGFAGSPHTWTARGLYSATGSTMDYLYESLGVFPLSPEVYGANSTSRVERVGSTGAFTVGISAGAAFNPDPDEVQFTADRWNRLAWYMLAATPNLELHHVAVAGGADAPAVGELVLDVGNDGLLPVDVSGTVTWAGGSASLEERRLQAGIGRWHVPAVDWTNDVEVSISGTLVVGTVPHVIDSIAVTLRLEPGGEVIVGGDELRPWRDLGSWLGGWFAPEGWDVPQRHHRGPEIPVDEPLLPTPDITPAGPLPTAVPTASAPAYLPRGLNGTEP